MVSHTIVPKPSIWAPSWILTASLALSEAGASSASVERGVYGVIYEFGETVVGCEMPSGRRISKESDAVFLIFTDPLRSSFPCIPSLPPRLTACLHAHILTVSSRPRDTSLYRNQHEELELQGRTKLPVTASNTL